MTPPNAATGGKHAAEARAGVQLQLAGVARGNGAAERGRRVRIAVHPSRVERAREAFGIGVEVRADERIADPDAWYLVTEEENWE